jgi:predicted nucleic acid-binding protein
MLSYADSSFLVRLVTRESGSEGLVAAYRRQKSPRLAFGPLHEIEVRNALRLKAWLERQQSAVGQHGRIAAEQAVWEIRLEGFLTRGTFSMRVCDWQNAATRAAELSAKHTSMLGTRAFDILHVAFALELRCKDFFTCDERQAKLAKAASLKVTLVHVEG